MNIAGRFNKRRFPHFVGLGLVLLILLVIVCAGALGEFLNPLQVRRSLPDVAAS